MLGKEGTVRIERVSEVAGTSEGSFGEKAGHSYIEMYAGFSDSTSSSSSSEDPNGIIRRKA